MQRENPNVLILSVDSLQYGYFSEALSEIAAQTDAVEFTDAVATANQTNSAMPGLAAGVYDDRLSTQGPPDSGGPTLLAEALAEAGYECGLWTDNFLFGAEYNYDRGFTAGNLGEATQKKQLATAIKNGPLGPAFGAFEWLYFNVVQRATAAVSGEGTFYRSADQLHDSAMDWLAEDREPYLCWIHYMDAHHPYEPPAEYLRDVSLSTGRSRGELGKLSRDVIKSNGENHSAEEIRDVAAVYRACCEYLRDSLSEFLDDLRAAGHFDPDRDVLVLTADHGERLDPAEYPNLGHFPTSFWEEIVHVPLAICRPDWSARTVDEQVSLIDVMPTVLDAVGLSTPDSADGTAAETPEEMIRQYAISVSQPPNFSATYRSIRHSSGWKLFGLDWNETNRTLLTQYDPRDASAEPVRHDSMSDTDPVGEVADRWEELESALEERARGPTVEEGQNVQADVPEEHLEDLGYIE